MVSSLSYLWSTRKTTLSAVSNQVTDSNLGHLNPEEPESLTCSLFFLLELKLMALQGHFLRKMMNLRKTKIFKKRFFRFILCVWVFCVNVIYVCALHACLMSGGRKGIRSTGPGVIDDCSLPCGCWVSNLVLCKSNTYFSQAEHLPSPLESQSQFFESSFALLAQQLILVCKVFTVFSLSKAPMLIQKLTHLGWKARGGSL